MGILFAILVLALSVWTLVALILRLRCHASSRLWFAFAVLLACGVAAGIWCAFYCDYPVGANFHIAGFPVPVVFFHFEDGQWVDFPVPIFQAWLAAIANVLAITALTTLPIWPLSRRPRPTPVSS